MGSMNGLTCERIEEWIIEKNDGSYVCSLQSAEQSKLKAEGDHANCQMPTAI